MFYAYIPLFSYMGPNLGQMPAAAALRLLRLGLEIPAADRGTVHTGMIKRKERIGKIFRNYFVPNYFVFRS